MLRSRRLDASNSWRKNVAVYRRRNRLWLKKLEIK
jgi:hypothetical protein